MSASSLATPHRDPATFFADRLRVARTKTGARLAPAFKNYASSVITATLALAIGSAVFGFSYFTAEVATYVAVMLAFTTVLSLALMIGTGTFIWYYLRAPAAIWKRDQETIEQLGERLHPRLTLTSDEDKCVRDLRQGSRAESIGGVRYHDVEFTARNYMVECSANIHVESVTLYIVDISVRDSEGHLRSTRLFDPVRLPPYSDGENSINYPRSHQRDSLASCNISLNTTGRT
jgi:hypothetical protein